MDGYFAPAPAGAFCFVGFRLTDTFPAIDCDVHPAAPTMAALLPFLEEYWRHSVVERGVPSLETNSYPARAPLSARPQWRGGNGAPDSTLGQLTSQVFGRFKAERAICNCLYGVELLFSEDQGFTEESLVPPAGLECGFQGQPGPQGGDAVLATERLVQLAEVASASS